ncbi:M16 family metallopeptidase [Mucilaginibacter rubeus]|uniref:Insulinase family protein n=1 Tax=Mucilaginibacter rubeus TaxID=2027860 RepID=A0A5C1I1R8_9SPHI|nr:M16 family metallopeptidase [Mucilaginibacter rubeus]QEM11746.1 insulinase family protein [Mucilaginibacter rubeus]
MHLNLRCGSFALALLAIVLPCSKTSAQTLSAGNAPDTVLRLDPSVRTGKLKNGLTYFIKHNTEPRKRALFYLVSKAGSILEDDNERGLAHFIEHMSFNGTKHYPKNELVAYLERSGVKFGADINAYTSFNETVYQLPLPSDDPQLIRNGVQILRDWAQDATLSTSEINSERGVILEEKRLRKGAAERMRNVYLPTLLNFSKYASRIPIGTEEVIQHAEPQVLKKFYSKWYRPDLQAVLIVGDINPDEMERQVKEKFADLKNPVNEIPRVEFTIPLTGKPQFVSVTDKEINIESAQIIIKHRAGKLKTVNDYRRMLTTQFMNQMLAARFSELLRSADLPFASGSAGAEDGLGGLENFSVSVSSNPGELDRGILAAWKEIERVKRFGFDEIELDRCKRSLMETMSAALKEKDKTASVALIREYTDYFLNGTAAPGIAKEYLLAKDMTTSITLKDVNELVKREITGQDMDIVVTGPEKNKENMLTQSDVLSLMKSAETAHLEPYHPQNNASALLIKQPKGGHIVNRSYDGKINVTQLVLSNGVKVFIKPTDFKNDEIVFNGFAPGGTSLYKDEEYQSAVSANLIPSFGAGNYGTTAMANYFNERQMRVQPFINERAQGFTGVTTRGAATDALELVYAYATEPRLDTAAFKSLISRTRAGIINRSGNPESVYQDTLNAVLTNNNPRKTGPSIEKLNKIDIDRAFGVYKERFADAAGFQFFFAGNIDSLTLYPLLEKYLGGLPASSNVTRPKDLNNAIPTGTIEKTVFKGQEQKSTVTMVYSGTFDYSMDSKLRLDALKDIIQFRLIERLREEESGVYSPRAVLNNNKYPESRYSLIISFGCAPENVTKLTAAVKDELEKLRLKGPVPAELEKFKAESNRTMEATLTTNAFWAAYLNLQAQNRENPDEILAHSRMIDNISAADVQNAATQYLSGNNLIEVILLPETKKNNP